MSEDCKHCSNPTPFPSFAQSLRNSVRINKSQIIANILRCKEDKGFKEIQNARYCCHSARYDAEDDYNKYFPYRGMANIESEIKYLCKTTSSLSKALRDKGLTAEVFMELDSCDGKIAQYIQSIEFTYKRLDELSWYVKKALKRETDPEKRKLLDGRSK